MGISSEDAESGTGKLGRTENRTHQRSGHSDRKKQTSGTGYISGHCSGRTAGANQPGTDSGGDAARGSEAVPGGILSQLIDSLLDQRALFEAQIENIDDQIQGLEALLGELSRRDE